MKVKIYYCVVWNYEPHAVGLAAELKKAHGIESELVSGNRGDFEVTIDGKSIFSKQKLSRFPEFGEISKIVEVWFFNKEITLLLVHSKSPKIAYHSTSQTIQNIQSQIFSYD